MMEIIVWSGAVVGGWAVFVWWLSIRDCFYGQRVIEALGDGEMRSMELKRAGAVSRWNCYPVLASMADRGLLTVRRSSRGVNYYRVFRGLEGEARAPPASAPMNDQATTDPPGTA